MLKRAIFPLVFVAVVTGTAGCKNSSTSTPSASATPTASPSPSPAPSGTATPTPGPATPTPVPTPTPAAYQPLASGDMWSYSCGTGITASKSVAVGPNINGNPTFADTKSLSTLPSPVTAMEATDLIGNTLVYQWMVGSTTTTLNPFGLEFPVNPTSGEATTYTAPGGGTTVTTFMGAQGSLTVAAGTFNNVVLFQSTTMRPIFPALASENDYMVLGVGPIRMQFPQNVPSLTCDLTTYTLH